MAFAVVSSFAKTGSPAASPRDRWDEVSFECAMLLSQDGFCCLMYPFFWNLQICCKTFNVDCKMFGSLHLVLCNMRASQLIFWDLAVQTLSASQAGRWEGCFPNCFFPRVVQILERAWISWWTSEPRHLVLCFLSLICSRLQERPCYQLHCHDPVAFEIVLPFPYMVRCKQFSELSSDESHQCKNL